MVEEPETDTNWLGQAPNLHVPDVQTRLNYVIPVDLEHLLSRYCAQTEMKSGPLVRRLISDFVKGDIELNCEALEHPKGRRTSVDLPARLLGALEERCEHMGVPTKAALIAALLRYFVPPRVDLVGEKLSVEIPTSIFMKIYERYGPGPDDEVIVDALCDLIQKTQSRAIPAETEA